MLGMEASDLTATQYSTDEPRKRKSACRRKADAEIKSKRFFNDLKDELLILEHLGWTEKRWKEESKLEKGRALMQELKRELRVILEELGLELSADTPWLERVELSIATARKANNLDLLKRLRAIDMSPSAPLEDTRSDWHTLFEIQRHFLALPPFRATKFLEPSNVRHALRCAEVLNRTFFERGRYIGGARKLSEMRMPKRRGALSADDADRVIMQHKIMEDLRDECVAGDLGVEEAFCVQVQLVIRCGSSEFIWEPGAEVKIFPDDRVFYEPSHVWAENRRLHCGESVSRESRVSQFERLLTGGQLDHVYEEDFEFVEMTARAESGAAEGVPAFLEHSVTGNADDAQRLFDRVHQDNCWQSRPKALCLGPLFKTRLAGYRHHRTREVVWGPGPETYWERGDRPLRLLRMAQEPVRVRFCRREAPYGFHLHDLRNAGSGVEVIEVVEGSPADIRGVVVGRTVKRLCYEGRSQDVRQWSRTQIEEVLQQMPEHFSIEFGKGDTEERRHAPLGDAEMAILMDERFMRGFLHELSLGLADGTDAGCQHFDYEGWGQVFPGLEVCSGVAGSRRLSEGAIECPMLTAAASPPLPVEHAAGCGHSPLSRRRKDVQGSPSGSSNASGGSPRSGALGGHRSEATSSKQSRKPHANSPLWRPSDVDLKSTPDVNRSPSPMRIPLPAEMPGSPPPGVFKHPPGLCLPASSMSGAVPNLEQDFYQAAIRLLEASASPVASPPSWPRASWQCPGGRPAMMPVEPRGCGFAASRPYLCDPSVFDQPPFNVPGPTFDEGGMPRAFGRGRVADKRRFNA